MKFFGLILIVLLCFFSSTANAQQKRSSSVRQTITLTLLNNVSIVDGAKILPASQTTEPRVLSTDVVQSRDKWIIQSSVSDGELVNSTENFSKNTDDPTIQLNSIPVRVSTISTM